MKTNTRLSTLLINNVFAVEAQANKAQQFDISVSIYIEREKDEKKERERERDKRKNQK